MSVDPGSSFAVVTGASSGIGFELARQFADHDFDVLVCAEDDGLAAAAAQLQSSRASVAPVQADLATYDGVETLLSAIGAAGRPVARGQGRVKDSGVTVTSLMPGPTDTNFFGRADMEDTPAGQGKKDDAAQIAADGFQALMAGKDHVVAGSVKNRVQVAGTSILPDSTKAAIHAYLTQPQK